MYRAVSHLPLRRTPGCAGHSLPNLQADQQNCDTGSIRAEHFEEQPPPKEEYPVLHAPPNFWVRYPAGEALVEHAQSLQEEPPIPPGTPDPYQP